MCVSVCRCVCRCVCVGVCVCVCVHYIVATFHGDVGNSLSVPSILEQNLIVMEYFHNCIPRLFIIM